MSGATSSQASSSSDSTGSGGPSTAINIPFTFVGCSAPLVPGVPASSPSSLSSPVLSKGGGGVTVSCPPRCQRVVCLLRLTRPCRLTRLIVRNAGSVFVCVRSAAPSVDLLGVTVESAGRLSWCELVPEHQLCAADVWRDNFHSRPLPAPLVRVHTFPSAGPMCGSFGPLMTHATTAALCVELRGAEDEWNREAKLGLSWLEVFGVPVQ